MDNRLALIKQVGEEIVNEDELIQLLKEKKHPIAYDGFEPSGKIHIAQGILRALNTNRMTKAGCKFKMLLADWHAAANNKMDGDLDKIKIVGNYMIEVWKAVGMDTDNVEFIWASDILKDSKYWKLVLDISRASTVNRIIRCGQIMGRAESEVLQASQILYPCMQAADIFELKVNITQLGMDQRKVNILARELAPKLGYQKPIIVSHHMLMGLNKPPETTLDPTEKKIQMKMSKSIPSSAIFMTDTEKEVNDKISKAYCPVKVTEENPILEYTKYLLFPSFNKLKIERQEKFGGDIELSSQEELETLYAKGDIHPVDIKNTVARYTNKLLEPVRIHFEKNQKAKDLLNQVNSFTVTR